jgi:protein disulfide-isomerase A1
MDATVNEHPWAKPDGYPTILFYPAGNKSFEPITEIGEKTRFYSVHGTAGQ